MSKIFFRIGQKFQWRGIGYRIDEVGLPDQQIKVFNIGLKKHELYGIEEVLQAYCADDLEFERDDDIKNKNEDPNQNQEGLDYSMLPGEKQDLIKQRYQIIKSLLDMQPSQRTTALVQQHSEAWFEKLISQLPLEEQEKLKLRRATGKRMPAAYAVSDRSIREWIRQFERSGRDIRSLLPQTQRSGGRGKKRIHPIADKKLMQALEAKFLQHNRPPLTKAYEELIQTITYENKFSAEPISIPHISTMRRRLGAMDPIDVMERRYGKDFIKRNGRLIGEGVRVAYPMERCEIDHSILPIIIIDEKHHIPLGRPVLTSMIDTHTKLITGFYCSTDPAGYVGVQGCLYHAIQPKLDAKKDYDTSHDWLGFGIPDTLVVDNGFEFVGSSLEDAALQLGMDIDRNDAYSPWLKPMVERLFRTLDSQLFANIPAATLKKIFGGSGYDDRREYRCLTEKVLNRILTVFFVDIYPYDAHRGLDGRCPAEVWNAEIERGRLPALPPDNQELKGLLGRKFTRKIHHYGIDFENLRYQNTESKDLFKLRTKLTTLSASEQQVTIKVDPTDLGSIYVFDHIYSKKFIPLVAVPSLQEYASGLSLYAHHSIHAYQQQLIRESAKSHEISLIEARNRLNEIISRDLVTVGSMRKARRAKRLIVHSDSKTKQTEKIDHPNDRSAFNYDDLGTQEQEMETDNYSESEGSFFSEVVDEWDVTNNILELR
ncbi:MAG: hypothetical protein CL609_23230 [Anaerolineaceae bacterium]|nr:hypothetical protein [Anaerolineaceae bacterium]